MTIVTIIYIALNAVFWLLMFWAVGKKKPGITTSSWSSIELKVWRAVTLCLFIAGLAALLSGCFGGGDLDDDRKNDPSPNCAMRPETCR